MPIKVTITDKYDGGIFGASGTCSGEKTNGGNSEPFEGPAEILVQVKEGVAYPYLDDSIKSSTILGRQVLYYSRLKKGELKVSKKLKVGDELVFEHIPFNLKK